ncbi:uncharacterized protein zgc:66455 isoform X2 [Corythoichthys intestinalis]|uniref:uncharacterized protein zgc:66455 isoform X2 n=1 Tax=Corythoichthys intestinalis TaxID=161448 RepID=UPI0025A5D665|nr:uncharacterized protein zgc:66455 isoform X2 [Corythoichthys intestinalis]
MQMFAGKTATLKSHALVLSLVLGPLWTSCKAQLYEDEAKQIPGEGGMAFFALRSCHQRLGGDSGDFFSPDYVCANPPLWCNWTIRATAGKRIHLNLQDLTPDEHCHQKLDQIEVNEPNVDRRVLRGCWREATYTSRLDTLHVILLIGGWPAQQYRGFYARYRTFVPPVAYKPPDGVSGNIPDMMMALEREQHPSATATVFTFLDYSDKATYSSLEKGVHAQPPTSHDLKLWLETTPLSDSPYSTTHTERGTPRMLSDLPELASQEHLKKLSSSPLHTLTAKRRDVALAENQHPPTEVEDKIGTTETPASSDEQSLGWTLSHPNIMEPLSDYHGKYNVWNASKDLHQPGDQLFEVTVEVQLSQERDRSQDHLDGSLMKSVKALVLQHLDRLHISLSLTLKRIKRLRAGELYIMWLNTGRGGTDVYNGVHQGLHKLLGSAVAQGANPHHGIIASVSIGDVNECGTQLSLCDINADCLDQFGSYWCRCKEGFRDESHLGPRGTVCVDQKPTGCNQGPSAETQGVYVLFFLLSTLLVISLVVACMLYRRHRRGAFMLKGEQSSSAQGYTDNTYVGPSDPDLPPPPPPARGPRDAWPLHKERCATVDLQLLRFSPLTPSDIYTDPQESRKK